MSSLKKAYDRVALSEQGFILRNLTTDGVIGGPENSNVDGSVTPVKFYTQPGPNERFSIRSAAVHISDSSVTRLDDYGSVPGPLTNGLGFYILINGVETLLGPGFKSNRAISDLGPIITRQAYISASTNIYEFRITQIASRGIELVGSRGDQFGIIVRDDLSSLTAHTVAVKGSVNRRVFD